MSGAHVTVLAKPGSKSPGLTWNGAAIVVRVRERAYEGKANEACREAIARALRVPPSSVELIRGGRAKIKVFTLHSLSRAELNARLASLSKSETQRLRE